MAKQKYNPKDRYELMENDEGEVMVLIFSEGGAPKNPSFVLNLKAKALELTRAPKDVVVIDGLKLETLRKMKKLQQIYVCEMKYVTEESSTSEIVYAYEAKLAPKPIVKEKKSKLEPSKLAEYSRSKRQKMLKKDNV